MSQGKRINTATDHGCFGCGANNPIGLKLAFYRHGERGVRANFTPASEHEGYDGLAHGGIISAVLDEAMSWAVVASGRLAVTTRMELQFRRATPVGESVEVLAEITRDRGRVVEARAEMRTRDGALLAGATGTFARVSQEQQAAWEARYFNAESASRQ